MKAKAGDGSVLRRAPALVTASVDTGALIIDAARAKFIDLNHSGAHFWALLDSPRTLAALVAAARRTFEIDDEKCRREIERWVEDMMLLGLVIAEDHTSSATAEPN